LVFDGLSARFGSPDQLAGDVVVEGPLTVRGGFSDETTGGVIAPHSYPGGAGGGDELAGVVVLVGRGAIGALQLGHAPGVVPGNPGDINDRGIDEGVGDRGVIVVFSSLGLVGRAVID